MPKSRIASPPMPKPGSRARFAPWRVIQHELAVGLEGRAFDERVVLEDGERGVPHARRRVAQPAPGGLLPRRALKLPKTDPSTGSDPK
jgi:hypothetical protein